ncbi:MAG: HNH endonuclease [Gemmatimonadota bacterium]
MQSVVPADSALRFPDVPDIVRTPGAALDVTAADICVSGYSKRVRNVPSAVKRQAYASYGVRSHEPGEYEIDHLISLSLGGSNSIRNLWPESFRTQPWNAYVKDELEDELHRRVCAGTIELAKAQSVISHNWVMGYRIYVHPKPRSAQARRKTRSRSRRSYLPPRSQFDSPVP